MSNAHFKEMANQNKKALRCGGGRGVYVAMSEIYLSFLAAAFALAGSPGPNTLSLAAVGAAFGWRRGLAYMLGLNLGMFLVIAAVGSGVTGTVLAIPGAAPVIAAAAVFYFLYLAYRIATAPPLSSDGGAGRPPPWGVAVLISLSNPKAYAAMAALFSGFILAAGDFVADFAAKTVVLMAVIFVVNAVWLLIGASLTPFFRDPKASRLINIGFAIALLAAVAASFLA